MASLNSHGAKEKRAKRKAREGEGRPKSAKSFSPSTESSSGSWDDRSVGGRPRGHEGIHFDDGFEDEVSWLESDDCSSRLLPFYTDAEIASMASLNGTGAKEKKAKRYSQLVENSSGSDDDCEAGGGPKQHEEFYNLDGDGDEDEEEDDDDDSDERRPLRSSRRSNPRRRGDRPPPPFFLGRAERCVNRILVLAFAVVLLVFVRDRTPWWKEHKRRAAYQKHHHHHVLDGTDDDDLARIDPMAVYNTDDDDAAGARNHDPTGKYDEFTKRDDVLLDPDGGRGHATAGERISSRPGVKTVHHGFAAADAAGRGREGDGVNDGGQAAWVPPPPQVPHDGKTVQTSPMQTSPMQTTVQASPMQQIAPAQTFPMQSSSVRASAGSDVGDASSASSVNGGPSESIATTSGQQREWETSLTKPQYHHPGGALANVQPIMPEETLPVSSQRLPTNDMSSGQAHGSRTDSGSVGDGSTNIDAPGVADGDHSANPTAVIPQQLDRPNAGDENPSWLATSSANGGPSGGIAATTGQQHGWETALSKPQYHQSGDTVANVEPIMPRESLPRPSQRLPTDEMASERTPGSRTDNGSVGDKVTNIDAAGVVDGDDSANPTAVSPQRLDRPNAGDENPSWLGTLSVNGGPGGDIAATTGQEHEWGTTLSKLQYHQSGDTVANVEPIMPEETLPRPSQRLPTDEMPSEQASGSHIDNDSMDDELHTVGVAGGSVVDGHHSANPLTANPQYLDGPNSDVENPAWVENVENPAWLADSRDPQYDDSMGSLIEYGEREPGDSSPFQMKYQTLGGDEDIGNGATRKGSTSKTNPSTQANEISGDGHGMGEAVGARTVAGPNSRQSATPVPRGEENAPARPTFVQPPVSAEDVKSAYEDAFYRWNHPFRPAIPGDATGQYDVPVFWRIPRSASGTVESLLSFCYRATLASSMGILAGHDRDETLDVMTVGTGAQYVNVDMSRPAGIRRAGGMGLGSSGLADVISTPFLFETAGVFRGVPQSGRIFTLLRHPVDRAVSLYHHYQVEGGDSAAAARYRGMTIDEFADKAEENNWMVRFLANRHSGSLTWHDLEAAKEVFGRKCLVGFVDRAEESLRRYERFFGWDERMPVPDAKDECLRRYLAAGDKRRAHPTYEGTAAWEVLRKKNEYDVLLYEFAKNLYTQQSTLYEKWN